MESINVFISLLIILLTVFAAHIYKIRSIVKYRLVETEYDGAPKMYNPQIKIEGIWFNLRKSKYYFETHKVQITHDYAEHFLDPQDALKLIDKFKEQGNFTIHSNAKLNSNQKQIIVE